MKKLIATLIILLVSIIFFFVILNIKNNEIAEKETKIAEKEKEITEMEKEIITKETEIITKSEKIAKMEEKEKVYQNTIMDLVTWASGLFPQHAGGALEDLKKIDFKEIDFNKKVAKLPPTVSEASHRTYYNEEIKKYPLTGYNFIFESLGWGYPVSIPEKSYVSEEFVRYREVLLNGEYYSGPHPAIDIVSPYESRAIAVAPGKITHIGKEEGLGYYIVIQCELPNEKYIYPVSSHLSQILVEVGDDVIKGQEIGIMGNTGSSSGRHLHFELREYPENPEDLKDYMKINPVSNSLRGNTITTTFYDGEFE